LRQSKFNGDIGWFFHYEISHLVSCLLKSFQITTSHKHLGVTLSSDSKWNNHIENINLRVSRHLGILLKLKYRLSRQNLEKLYLVRQSKFNGDIGWFFHYEISHLVSCLLKSFQWKSSFFPVNTKGPCCRYCYDTCGHVWHILDSSSTWFRKSRWC
jgi:hypothetical protein